MLAALYACYASIAENDITVFGFGRRQGEKVRLSDLLSSEERRERDRGGDVEEGRLTLGEIWHDGTISYFAVGLEIEFCVDLRPFTLAKILAQSRFGCGEAFVESAPKWYKYGKSCWVVERDDSPLCGRLAPQPLEIVSPVLNPSAVTVGEPVQLTISRVVKLIRSYGAVTDVKHAGLHVHVDGSSLSLQSLKVLTILYRYFEPVLQLFVPEGRRGEVDSQNVAHGYFLPLHRPLFCSNADLDAGLPSATTVRRWIARGRSARLGMARYEATMEADAEARVRRHDGVHCHGNTRKGLAAYVRAVWQCTSEEDLVALVNPDAYEFGVDDGSHTEVVARRKHGFALSLVNFDPTTARVLKKPPTVEFRLPAATTDSPVALFWLALFESFVRAAERETRQIRSHKIGSRQIGSHKIGSHKIGSHKVGGHKIGAGGQGRAAQERPYDPPHMYEPSYAQAAERMMRQERSLEGMATLMFKVLGETTLERYAWQKWLQAHFAYLLSSYPTYQF